MKRTFVLPVAVGVCALMVAMFFGVAPARAMYANKLVHNNTGTTKYDLHHAFTNNVEWKWQNSYKADSRGHRIGVWPPSGTHDPVPGEGTDFGWGNGTTDAVNHCEYIQACLRYYPKPRNNGATYLRSYWTPTPQVEIPDFSLKIVFKHFPDCSTHIEIHVDCAASQSITITNLEWAIVQEVIPGDSLYWAYVDPLPWNSIGPVTLGPAQVDSFSTHVEPFEDSGPHIIVRSPVVFTSSPDDTTAYVIYENTAALIPTFVELTSFDAIGNDGSVEVTWKTASEVDNAGFNIHRGLTQEGPTAKINDQLIPAQGSATEGATYTIVDQDVTNGVTYYYWLEDVDLSGRTAMHGPASATPMPSSVAEEPMTLPTSFDLAQNYPNPFNAATDIRYSLPVDCDVNLTIYNLAGQTVKTLVTGHQSAGQKVVNWNGRSDNGEMVTSGLYFYRLQAGDYVDVKQMVFLK